MINKFIEFNNTHNLFTKNDRTILAVSGGRDSIFMIEMFLKSKILDTKNIALAHVNFSLRGSESDEDEMFVKQYANSKSLKLFTTKFDTNKYAANKKLSIQIAARELRYNWFKTLLKEYNYNKIAIAHNANDQVETFFINLIRGSGLKGISGINIKNNEIIRPVIFAKREEITKYLNKHKIKWRDDSSNNSTKYLRNKIRHNIIPLFEEISLDFTDKMTENIKIFEKSNKLLNYFINKEINSIIEQNDDIINLKINTLIRIPNYEIILFEIIKKYNFSSAQLNDILNVINSESGKYIKSSTHKLVKHRNLLQIAKLSENNDVVLIKNIDEFKTKANIEYEVSTNIPKSFLNKNNIAYLDFDKIKFPLTIRHWQNADKFKPLGMSNFQKISSFFKNNKLSIIEKNKVLLLCNNNGDIVWIINHRIDNRYKISDKSNKILILKTKQ